MSFYKSCPIRKESVMGICMQKHIGSCHQKDHLWWRKGSRTRQRERRDVTEAPDHPTGSSKSGMEHPSFPKWRQGAQDFVCLHELVIRCSLLSRRGHNLTKAAFFSPEWFLQRHGSEYSTQPGEWVILTLFVLVLIVAIRSYWCTNLELKTAHTYYIIVI